MKIIKLLRWRRVGLSSTILFVSILALLNTINSFADDYFPESQPSFNIQQQKKQIAGIVTDAKGEAVIGAISRVTLDDKTSRPNMNLSQALSGTMVGVNLSSWWRCGHIHPRTNHIVGLRD